jgi:C4-dicarboxylate-specific signal transduction histidine kinase
LVGKRDSDFFGDEHAREALDDEQTIIRTGEPIINKVEKETWQDGHVTWALSSKMPLRDVQGEIIGTFGISKDITTIKDAEEKLNEVHKQLVDASRQAGMAEVATSVLHNVGNVLNSVNVSSSLIADKMRNSKIANIAKVVTLIRAHNNDLGNFFTNDPKGKQVPDYLANLASHLAREQEDILHEVGALVNNIIHIKEIVAMQQSYAKSSGVLETLKVTDLVEDAIRMNDGAMSRHNVKVARNFADVPPLLTEKHKVLQILVNLIRNAKYACDDSGREDKQITLRVANGEGRVKISVIDNGIGIPAENLTRIFNHGFTTRKDGHGFGLHSGANAAKEMGGSLAVFSDGLGRGATFTLELPVQKQKTDL